ncbi:AraC family transcriptional regulator [Paenibacillus methanolicus]|uniref:AraC-like DNA-binding protein n=1 Tax=Paenibacillus methanolicus TaxID=582686 RepID=A0A5S5CJ91_9BACL|nr:AraC family transcriptional regulator [Paenibacillus methanolicus]TYP79810.1 AraC-like DNA-binding protein [Paenibacillus methanolicus]
MKKQEEPGFAAAKEQLRQYDLFTRLWSNRRWDVLDRLDLQFRWGGYGVRVLRCHLTAFSPGQTISFHQHSEYELHFIPQGRGKVAFQHHEYELKAGMFYITGPGVMHQQWSDEAEPMYEFCLHCDIQPLEDGGAADGTAWGEAIERGEAEECVRLLGSSSAIPVADRFNAMSCFMDAYRIYDEQRVGFYTSLKSAIIQMLLRAVRPFAPAEQTVSIPERDMNAHRYRQAKQYMEDNASRPITLEEVALAAGVSPRQLQRIFVQEGSLSFREELEEMRMTRICSDLAVSSKPIDAIAQAHGYANVNYLYPVFKKKFGLTPAAYRKRQALAKTNPLQKEPSE